MLSDSSDTADTISRDWALQPVTFAHLIVGDNKIIVTEWVYLCVCVDQRTPRRRGDPRTSDPPRRIYIIIISRPC